MSDIIHHLIAGAPKPVAPYNHLVECDGWLFATGQLATDPDDNSLPMPEGIEAQMHKVMDNLRRALEGAGAGFDRVVFLRIFLTRFECDYAKVNEIYQTYFAPDELPGRTTVGVTHLARGGIIEIDMIARRPCAGFGIIRPSGNPEVAPAEVPGPIGLASPHERTDRGIGSRLGLRPSGTTALPRGER